MQQKADDYIAYLVQDISSGLQQNVWLDEVVLDAVVQVEAVWVEMRSNKGKKQKGNFASLGIVKDSRIDDLSMLRKLKSPAMMWLSL